jgi:hypothetical protein
LNTTTNVTSRTADYTDLGTDGQVGGGDDVTGTVTFSWKINTGAGSAKLVGTSCPECGVMTP